MIAWTGKTLGIKAIHAWELKPRNDATRVRTEESYEGLVARLFRGSLQKTLDRALADGVRYLKAEVEAPGIAGRRLDEPGVAERRASVRNAGRSETALGTRGRVRHVPEPSAAAASAA